MIKGFDVYHGDEVDFSRVDSSNRKFCWIKSSQGSTYSDPMYELYLKQLDSNYNSSNITNPLIIGAYHYLIENNSIAQANLFCNKLDILKASSPNSKRLFPLLDIESLPFPSTKTIISFCSTIKKHIGHNPILYFSLSNYISTYQSDFPSDKWTINIARYPYNDDGETIIPIPTVIDPPPVFMQYSEKGTLYPGSHETDLDLFTGTLEELIKDYTY